MIEVNGYKQYFGGKSGSGTYQQIINKIPPHKRFKSLFLGNCGVTRHIKPAEHGVLNDLDSDLVASWKNAMLPANYAVLNCNALDLLAAGIAENEDTDDTFIYLDPPYLLETRKCNQAVYKYQMTTLDHQLLLAEILKYKKAMVMISAYPNAMYDEFLAGWNTYDFYSTIRNGVALERLYFNYDIGDLLHDYRFIGANFRERERVNRIKNNFLLKLERLDAKLRNSILTDLSSHIK